MPSDSCLHRLPVLTVISILPFYLSFSNVFQMAVPVQDVTIPVRLLFYIVYGTGPGSSVGKATCYGLDGPGSNPDGDEIFRPSRPALGSNQSIVKWVPGLSRG